MVEAVTDIQHLQAYNEEALTFIAKISEKSGLSPTETHLPKAINPCHVGSTPDITIDSSMAEARMCTCGAIDGLLNKTGLSASDVDILVTCCSIFCPTPSISAMIVNEFKMKPSIQSYHLGGMGCSMGVVSVNLIRDLLKVGPETGRGINCAKVVCFVELAYSFCFRIQNLYAYIARVFSCTLPFVQKKYGHKLCAFTAECKCPNRIPEVADRKHLCKPPRALSLPSALTIISPKFQQILVIFTDLTARVGCLTQAHPNSNAILVTTETTTPAYYPGKDRSRLVANMLFRMGGCAVLFSNKACMASKAKYELQTGIRIHQGYRDEAFRSVEEIPVGYCWSRFPSVKKNDNPAKSIVHHDCNAVIYWKKDCMWSCQPDQKTHNAFTFR